MRSLPNRLIAGLKWLLLVAVIAAASAVSVGAGCEGDQAVQFGYRYDHVTPPLWTPDGRHVILSRNGVITVAAVDGSGSFWHIHEIRDRLNDRQVRHDDSRAPKISPDGTDVAYMHRYTRDDVARDLNYEIHVASIDGSNIRRLTENDYHEASPVWSPDNTRIAYWSSSLESPAWALMTMAKDGTDKRHVITVDRGDPPPVVWSPDGRHLAFVQLHRTPTIEHAIYVVGEDGSNPTRLAPTSSLPLWSHDGKNIFFVHVQEVEDRADVSAALYSVRTDGTDLHIVADIGMWPRAVQFQARLKWSADGSEIWFNPRVSVARIKADGTSISVLEKRYFTGSTIRTAFSPDGSTLAVQVVETGPGLSEEDDKDVVLFVMDPDGSNPREVFRRALGDKLNWGGSLPTDNLIEWKLTQYTPTQEQDAQTTATAG